jgi:hypothetical protein
MGVCSHFGTHLSQSVRPLMRVPREGYSPSPLSMHSFCMQRYVIGCASIALKESTHARRRSAARAGVDTVMLPPLACTSHPSALAVAVLRRLDFDADLRRMGVLIKLLPSPAAYRWAFRTKGGGEAHEAL